MVLTEWYAISPLGLTWNTTTLGWTNWCLVNLVFIIHLNSTLFEVWCANEQWQCVPNITNMSNSVHLNMSTDSVNKRFWSSFKPYSVLRACFPLSEGKSPMSFICKRASSLPSKMQFLWVLSHSDQHQFNQELEQLLCNDEWFSHDLLTMLEYKLNLLCQFADLGSAERC